MLIRTLLIGIFFSCSFVHAQGWKQYVTKNTSEGKENKVPKHSEKSINFSKNENVSIPEKNNGLSATFVEGDPVYFNTNFSTTTSKGFGGVTPQLNVWVNGKLIYKSQVFGLKGKSETSYKALLIPGTGYKGPQDSRAVELLRALIKEIDPGNHKILVGWTMYGYNEIKNLGWHGEFNMNSATLDKWKSILSSIENKMNDDIDIPKSKINNPQMEKEMLLVANSYGTKEKYIECRIQSEGKIFRDKISGAITHKLIRTVMIVKYPDGSCGYVDPFTFKQIHDGTKYGPLKFKYSTKPKKVDCSLVK